MKAIYSIYFLGLVVTGSLYTMEYKTTSSIIITSDDYDTSINSNISFAIISVHKGIQERLALKDIYITERQKNSCDAWVDKWHTEIDTLQASTDIKQESKKLSAKKLLPLLPLYEKQNNIIEEFLLPKATIFHQLSISIWPRIVADKKGGPKTNQSFLQFPTAPFSSEEIYQLTVVQKFFEDLVKVSKKVINALPIDESPYEEKEKSAGKLFYLIDNTYFI
ncbi:MAG TPA: hypothetical protein VGW78_01470 [Candidatus Babeliales bacterium]|jgi:hypothetical protein|nr:hypothetical protein [Candidatus Babeliales bacterium]